MFGPEYTKIQTLFKRDDRGVIIPEDWTTEEFSYLSDKPWFWTEKIDGTNLRLHWNGSIVAVGGRTDNAQVPAWAMVELGRFFDPRLWEATFPGSPDVTVYGELYGPKIQKGKQYREDHAVAVFDVKVGEWWLRKGDVHDVTVKLGLEQVPYIKAVWTPEEAVERVQSGELTSNFPGARIEGLVGRPAVDLYDRAGDRIIAKIKGKDFADLERRGGRLASQQPTHA